MAQQQYEANHQPGVRPVAAIRDDPIHVVHARNPQLPLQVPNQPIERRQELPSHLDQDVDKWTEFRKFVIRGLKGKTNSFAKTWRTRYTFLVVGLKQSEIIDGVIAAVNLKVTDHQIRGAKTTAQLNSNATETDVNYIGNWTS
eukprot:762193_1